MNTMNMPGFTADDSLYETSGRYQSEATRSLGNGTKDNQVYMQKPNSQNTPGGSCYGHTSCTTISGIYDSMGRCCIYPSNGFPFASIAITTNAMIGDWFSAPLRLAKVEFSPESSWEWWACFCAHHF
jgi:hypothetical protein